MKFLIYLEFFTSLEYFIIYVIKFFNVLDLNYIAKIEVEIFCYGSFLICINRMQNYLIYIHEGLLYRQQQELVRIYNIERLIRNSNILTNRAQRALVIQRASFIAFLAEVIIINTLKKRKKVSPSIPLYTNISSNYERLNERLKNLKTLLYKRLKRIVVPGFEPGSKNGRLLVRCRFPSNQQSWLLANQSLEQYSKNG